jgi:hypothetical protein
MRTPSTAEADSALHLGQIVQRTMAGVDDADRVAVRSRSPSSSSRSI